MNMRKDARGWEYQCARCGRWSRQAWLVGGHLLDLECMLQGRTAARVGVVTAAVRALTRRVREWGEERRRDERG